MPNRLSFEYAPFKVEAGKIKEFVHSIGLTNPIYFDKEIALQKGFKDIPVPQPLLLLLIFGTTGIFISYFYF